MILPKNIKIYGDVSWRGNCPTETVEAVTFFSFVRRQWPNDIGLIATHIKNEGKRRNGQANWDKAQGMIKGASDIIIPGRVTFTCELKRRDHTKSKISAAQIEYLEAAQANGAFACVALGWEAAVEAVREWVQL